MKKKLTGSDRRKSLITWLKEVKTPITGTELAKRANVSRQVIVQDISLLKAQDHPIIATSNGYLYMQNTDKDQKQFERVIACNHDSSRTKEELYTIVDFGVTVKDVSIEHPVYGDLKASLLVSSRADVDQFVKRIEEENAPYLLELTGGVHNHTITAYKEQKIEQAVEALERKNFLIKQ